MAEDKKPFAFDEREDTNLRSYVFQALGAASMAWNETPTGVFESEWALEIGEALMKKIEEWVLETPDVVCI